MTGQKIKSVAVLTMALDIVFDEVSVVRAFVCPGEAALAVFASFNIVSFIACAIWPSFQALTMLLVFFPVALVAGSIEMTVHSESVRLIILPVSVVDVSVGMNQPALSVGLVVLPVAFVHGPVGPDLDSTALSYLSADEPFTLVPCSVFEDDHDALLSVAKRPFELVVVIAELAELAPHFLHVDIIVVFSTVLSKVAHAWLEYLLSELLNSLASKPAPHGCLASYDDDELLKRVMLSVERLPASRVSRC